MDAVPMVLNAVIAIVSHVPLQLMQLRLVSLSVVWKQPWGGRGESHLPIASLICDVFCGRHDGNLGWVGFNMINAKAVEW